MPTPLVPDGFRLVRNIAVDSALRNQTTPMVDVELTTPLPTETSCNYNLKGTLEVNFTQVQQTQDQIDDGWLTPALIQIAVHCRIQYSSGLNPELVFEA